MPFDPWRFKAIYPDRWGRFIRSNFRTVFEVEIFFSVSERCARNWWDGANMPQAHIASMAQAAFPQSYAAIVMADVA